MIYIYYPQMYIIILLTFGVVGMRHVRGPSDPPGGHQHHQGARQH